MPERCITAPVAGSTPGKLSNAGSGVVDARYMARILKDYQATNERALAAELRLARAERALSDYMEVHP